MCLGIPGKVIKIKGQKAKIDQIDHCHWVDISNLDQKAKLGDYLISYQQVAINKISSKDARQILSMLENSK